jgi:DNA helicase HerA-like ATPase
LGSTGSGKSTSVSSLLRSIVMNDSEEVVLPSSRIVLFDLHGEYASALSDIATVYSVTPRSGEQPLYIPYWCVSPENLIEFLCGNNETVKNRFIERMVEEKRKFIVDNALAMDPNRVTPFTPLPFRLKHIWYNMWYDDNVNWNDKDKTEAAVISEGDPDTLTAPKFYPPGTGSQSPHKGGPQMMKKSLELMRARLLERQYDFFLHPGQWEPNGQNSTDADLPDLIKGWIGGPQPITILDLSGMPSSRLDLLLGSVLDVLFESAIWGRHLEEGMRERPLLLVMEEAHRYISRESNGLSKDMVRRIVKEGRKFGVGSMLVSQRPSEIDETILSQCGTLFALRINNATDRSRVKSAMSDGLSGIVDSLPILRTGEAIVTGEAARMPMRVRFKIPKDGRFPDSSDPEVTKKWSAIQEDGDYQSLVDCWRLQESGN